MSALTIVFTVLQVLAGLAVTVIVLMQSGKSAGLSGAIAGGADTFMSKGKAKSMDAKLAKSTKWFALAFVVLTLILNIIELKNDPGSQASRVVLCYITRRASCLCRRRGALFVLMYF